MLELRPRSIVRTVLIAIASVAGPLIAAVITAVVQVDRLAEESHQAVLRTEAATQQARSLSEQLAEMERSFGQFLVLGDQRFYDNYLDRRQAFRQAASNLAGLGLGGTVDGKLEDLLAQEQHSFQTLADLHEHPDGADVSDTSPLWDPLFPRVRDIVEASRQMVNQEASNTTAEADRLQNLLLAQASAVIPASIILAAIFVVMITRPVRELSQAIRGLGDGDFDAPIRIRGPRDLEEVGSRLDWLRERIRALEQQKTDFLRHMSHELKTPLTTIREGAELLSEMAVEEPQSEAAEITEIVRSNSLHLQHLIEDLLQFGRTLEPVTVIHAPDMVDLHTLLRSAMSGQALATSAKRIVINAELAPVRVWGEAAKLRTVADNLLANAIKFTPTRGRIDIILKEVEGYAQIDVIDNGPGVNPADAARLFEPFYQGGAEHDSHVDGTGLGLAIVKSYVEAHQGTVEVMACNTGAHFRVCIPAGTGGESS